MGKLKTWHEDPKNEAEVLLIIRLIGGENKSYYSLPKDERKGVQHVVNAMTKRLLNKLHSNFMVASFFVNDGSFTVLQSFINQGTATPNGQLNYFKTRTREEDHKEAVLRCVIYFKAGGRKVFPSYLHQELTANGNLETLINLMADSLLFKGFSGLFNTAIFYFNRDKENTRVLRKYDARCNIVTHELNVAQRDKQAQQGEAQQIKTLMDSYYKGLI